MLEADGSGKSKASKNPNLKRIALDDLISAVSDRAYTALEKEGFRFCIEIKWERDGEKGTSVHFSMPKRKEPV